MKYRRTQRQYEEMSARFTCITGSVGYTALHDCTDAMEGVVKALERAADDPGADLEALVGDLERMIGCTDAIDQYLGQVRNSCVRYCNAFEELAPTCPPPRPRLRLDPGSSSRGAEGPRDPCRPVAAGGARAGARDGGPLMSLIDQCNEIPREETRREAVCLVSRMMRYRVDIMSGLEDEVHGLMEGRCGAAAAGGESGALPGGLRCSLRGSTSSRRTAGTMPSTSGGS